MFWSEYGGPGEYRTLPNPMYEAHVAIMEGEAKRRKDDMEDAQE